MLQRQGVWVGIAIGFLSGCAAAVSKPPPLVVEPGRFSYTFADPQRWEFSFDEAQRAGVRLVFYPTGGDFHESNTIVYVNEICRPGCANSVDAAVDQTIATARHESPLLQVAIMPPLTDKDGREAVVRVLSGSSDARQAREALAFIPHDESIVLVVLTTKDVSSWNADYAAFSDIVRGHRYFNCNSPDLAVPCR
jgi:hypothetical protein